jgi:hypothetical protein
MTMRKFLLAATAAIAAVLIGPQFLEGTSDSCGALANQLVTNHAAELPTDPAARALAMGVMRTIGGPLVAMRVKEINRGIPQAIACPVSYWIELVKPGALAEQPASRR